MKIAAITRYKQGDLYEALKSLGWTQLELGRKVGLSIRRIQMAINMERRPSLKAFH
jgi:transcriptional regulator with XRE-family HTH domain